MYYFIASLLILLVIAIAANHITHFFKKFHIPVISVLLFVGTICGPFILQMVTYEQIKSLSFIDDLSLSFIALVAGAELYLNELRSRMKSIIWITATQVVITLVLGTSLILFLAPYLPFMSDLDFSLQLGIALLMSSIFIARSPSSVIAVINEMRAKGPFTQTIMGVTVLTDVLVILIFSICLAFVKLLIDGGDFNIIFLFIILLNLILSFGVAIPFGKILSSILRFSIHEKVKILLLLTSSYSVYLFCNWFAHFSSQYFMIEIEMEPLLICIVGSFIVTNYSSYRSEFLFLLEKAAPYIYILFFTYTGSTLEVNKLLVIGMYAILFFFIRIFCLFISSFIGGWLARDPMRYNHISWMSYISQAGVSLGLAAIIAFEFEGWGNDFATIIISIVIINQFVGPISLKWALSLVKETHTKAVTPRFDGEYNAIIFGLEDLSLALANQLKSNGWKVQIVTLQAIPEEKKQEDITIHYVNRLSKKFLFEIGANKSEAIVCLLSDKENYEICSMAYEHLGTKDIIVRLLHREYFDSFHKLGVKIVDPSTAMISLLDQFVRSPIATSLFLGMEEGKATMEVEILNRNLHGLALRNLRLPTGVIVVSLKRKGHFVITHGFTRLRLRDFVTLVGEKKDLENVRLKFS